MAKKISMRKCVSCNERKEKNQLLRIVNNKDLGIKIDITGKLNGRGAYICKDIECIKKAEKNKALDRALKTNVDDNLYKEIIDYVDSL